MRPSRPFIEVRARVPVVLRNLTKGGAVTLADYERRGGYAALAKASAIGPDAVIRHLELSELRGRGGAGYLTGAKWRAVQKREGAEKFVIANADEGDPGAYIDRFLMEEDPFCLIEALTIAGFVAGAHQGYIYVRAEYPDAFKVLVLALAEARSARLLGHRILSTDFDFDIEVVQGHGSYVCGEETALLRAVEGKRPEVSARPPFPTESGLWKKPTLVNNVETLANIPWIVLHGGDQYRALGCPGSRGTKVLSLNSVFRWPGLYEVEFGVTLREIVEDYGGGLRNGRLKGLLIGGPLTGIVPTPLLDTPLDFGGLRKIGASVGHGGVIAFDERISIVALAHHVFSFAAIESCGKCTPCRLGSRRIEVLLKGIIDGKPQKGAMSEIERLLPTIGQTSLCGLGTGLAEFGESLFKYFREELEQWAA